MITMQITEEQASDLFNRSAADFDGGYEDREGRQIRILTRHSDHQRLWWVTTTDPGTYSRRAGE